MDFSYPVKNFLNNAKVQTMFILLLTLLVYFPALFAGFIWDDDALYDNPLIKTADGLLKLWTSPRENIREIHYWPLTYTSFWLEYRIWGNTPFGYHLINILFHISNVLLLWQILRKLVIPGAYLISLIFALHPVHVESVAWVIERKDVLSAFFYLLALWFYLKFRDASFEKRIYFYLLSLFCFLCAMLSKSIAVSLPVAMVLGLWWKNGKINKSDWLSLIPFFVVAFLLAYTDLQYVKPRYALTSLGLTHLQRFYIAGKSLWFYLEKLVFPFNLMTVYPRWNLNINFFYQLLFPGLFLVFLLGLFLGKKYWGKGLVTAFTFFAITVSPTLGLVDFNYMYHSFVADRFQYLASIGPIILIGTGFYKLYQITCLNWKSAVRIGLVALLGLLGFLTWKQTELYETDETLFRHTIAKNPNAWLAYNNLGFALAEQNKFDEAIQYYLKSIALKPDFVYVHNNLGLVLLKQGKYQAATKYFEQAVLFDPKFVEAYDNLGVAYAVQGKFAEAIVYFKKALSINPHNAQAKFNLEKATAALDSTSKSIPSNGKSKE